MKKIPSYLKGLAERRARVAADLARYQRVKGEVEGELNKARKLVTRYEQSLVTLEKRIKEAEAVMASSDCLIRDFDERLDPEAIEPIQAWRGRYGRRGSLKAGMVALLQEKAPEPVTTFELAWALQIQLGIDFESEADRRKWLHNSVTKQLRVLVQEGVLERLHDPYAPGGEDGLWRHRKDADGVDDLRAMAESAGLGVQQKVRKRANR